MTIMTTLVNMVPSAVQAQEVQQNGLVSLKKEGMSVPPPKNDILNGVFVIIIP